MLHSCRVWVIEMGRPQKIDSRIFLGSLCSAGVPLLLSGGLPSTVMISHANLVTINAQMLTQNTIRWRVGGALSSYVPQ